MSSKTEYLNTERADVPITTATGEKVAAIDGNNPQSTTYTSTQPLDSYGVAQSLHGASHVTHVEHDAPHTAQEKPSLPRHGGL